jgi:hypothetical protein
MDIQSIFTTALPCFAKKPYTLAGFEPGPSVYQADATTTAPRRQLLHFSVSGCACSSAQSYVLMSYLGMYIHVPDYIGHIHIQ